MFLELFSTAFYKSSPEGPSVYHSAKTLDTPSPPRFMLLQINMESLMLTKRTFLEGRIQNVYIIITSFMPMAAMDTLGGPCPLALFPCQGLTAPNGPGTLSFPKEHTAFPSELLRAPGGLGVCTASLTLVGSRMALGANTAIWISDIKY